MKNSELIPKVKEWLDANPEDRDLAAGALLVLQLTNNRIMYQNFMRKPKLYASRIEYELKKKYQFYLQQLTHEQVAEMGKQVEVIAKSPKSITCPTSMRSSRKVSARITMRCP